MKRFLVLLTIALALLAVPAAAQDRGAVSGAEAAIGELVSESGSLRSELIPLFLVVTVLSLAPGIAIMVTCFPFMAIVFSFLRQAIGLQHAPPAMMLTSLALFLTFYVMEPVFSTAWQEGLKPLMDGAVDETAGIAATLAPRRAFM